MSLFSSGWLWCVMSLVCHFLPQGHEDNLIFSSKESIHLTFTFGSSVYLELSSFLMVSHRGKISFPTPLMWIARFPSTDY